MAETSTQTLDYKLARRTCARYVDTVFKLGDIVMNSPDLENLMMKVDHKQSSMFREDVNKAYLNSLALCFVKGHDYCKNKRDITDLLEDVKTETGTDRVFFSKLEKYVGDKSELLRKVYYEDKARAANLGFGYYIVYAHEKREENLREQRDKAVSERQEMKKKLGYTRLQKILLGTGVVATLAAATICLYLLYSMRTDVDEGLSREGTKISDTISSEGTRLRKQVSNEGDKIRKQMTDEELMNAIKPHLKSSFAECIEAVAEELPFVEKERLERLVKKLKEPETKKE